MKSKTMTRNQQLSRILKLYDLFHAGKIPTLSRHVEDPGLPKGSRENYLYFTLPPCLNFQRSSPAMWASAFKTLKDPKTHYLFFPEKITTKPRAQIQSDLIKHKLALQKNKHTDIWIAISRAFHKHFNDDPRELLKTAGWSVTNVHRIIQQEKHKDFPYISGPKMSNYWLYILSEYTDAKFKNMQEISIIPDTHVLQCSIKLGLSKPESTPIEVAAIWKKLLEGSKLSPVEMHPVLWNWSRNNFLPEI